MRPFLVANQTPGIHLIGFIVPNMPSRSYGISEFMANISAVMGAITFNPLKSKAFPLTALPSACKYNYAMLTHAQITAARDKETEAHNQKMRAFDTLMQLVDPATGVVPQEIYNLFVDAAAPARPLVVTQKGGAVTTTTLTTREQARPLNTLERAIWEFAEHTQGEYTSGIIRDALRQSGLPWLPANQDALMNGISAALQSLVDRSFIERTYQGRGRDPHRYKTIPREGQATE
jgi:hypothetical protein